MNEVLTAIQSVSLVHSQTSSSGKATTAFPACLSPTHNPLLSHICLSQILTYPQFIVTFLNITSNLTPTGPVMPSVEKHGHNNISGSLWAFCCGEIAKKNACSTAVCWWLSHISHKQKPVLWAAFPVLGLCLIVIFWLIVSHIQWYHPPGGGGGTSEGVLLLILVGLLLLCTRAKMALKRLKKQNWKEGLKNIKILWK